MSNDSRKLTKKEITSITENLDKKYLLEAYLALKNVSISSKATKKDIETIEQNIKKFLQKKNIPRKFTEAELDDIVSIIPKMPSPIESISIEHNKQLKETVKKQLVQHKCYVSKESIGKIKKYLKKQYLGSLCSAGDAVGVMSAMSYGQPLSQSNLNAFHTSGSKNENKEGLSSLEELFNLSKERSTNDCVVHFKNKNLTKEEIMYMKKILKGINVETLVQSSEILDTLPEDDKFWYQNYKLCKESDFTYSGGKFLRLNLNSSLCFKYEISAGEIASVIEKNTESSFVDNSVYCVFSPTYKGIIDIHGNPDFIEASVKKFILSGEKLPSCEKVNVKKNQGTSKVISGTEDTKTIFLKIIIQDCLKYMMIKGIKNIREIRVPPSISIISLFSEHPITDSMSLEKYSKKPFNVNIEDFDKLWRLKVKKNLTINLSIPLQKIINLLKSVKVEVLEIDEDTDEIVMLMPVERTELYFNSKNEEKPLYTLKKDGSYYNNKEEKIDTSFYGVKKLIENILTFEKDKIQYTVKQNINSKILEYKLPDYSDTYRYGYYCYATIEGAKGTQIISELLNHKLVDKNYTYPNNVNEIFRLFGVEAARYYLLTRYNMNSDIMKINPAHPELLVDYQTSIGKILPVSYTGTTKVGNTTLSTAAFQNAMESFSKSASFGKIDKIKGTSSCIITGSTCEQGTGIASTVTDPAYLENETNKHQEDSYVQEEKVYQDQVAGNCFSLGNLQANTINEEGEEVYIPEGRKYKDEPSVVSDGCLCPKENIQNPFTMAMPQSIKELLDNVVISFDDSDDENVTNIVQNEEIPDFVEDNSNKEDLDFRL